jgi:hypothetical protein
MSYAPSVLIITGWFLIELAPPPGCWRSAEGCEPICERPPGAGGRPRPDGSVDQGEPKQSTASVPQLPAASAPEYDPSNSRGPCRAAIMSGPQSARTGLRPHRGTIIRPTPRFWQSCSTQQLWPTRIAIGLPSRPDAVGGAARCATGIRDLEREAKGRLETEAVLVFHNVTVFLANDS